MDQPDLRSAEHYINRELSLLEFNERVLAQALDRRIPLLERLKFLCISSNNLDEFFEIRVAGLKQRLELGSNQPGADGLSITEQLQAIHDRTRSLVDAQYACLNEVLLPALRHQGIELLARATWDTDTAQWLERYFEREVEPVLSPLGLDPARPFPRIQNKSLNFIVRLAGQDAFGRDTGLAIVQAPRSLPRVVALPEKDGRKRVVLLTGIVQQFVSKLFSGMEVLGCYQFRVTRNSDLFVDDEEVDDLRRALEGELAHRRYGAAVRLEVSRDCPPDLDSFLMRQFTLAEVDFYEVSGPVNLNRLEAIYDLVQRPDLKYPIFTPGLPRRVAGSTDLLAVIRQKDVLLHHPFHSFGPVLDFLRGAAADPRVLAIKQTLYRTSGDSPIVSALIDAAEAGKQVVALVEIKARFDEQANIKWARALEQAGVHVVYGLIGLKTHCKTCLVVRREGSTIRRYCHIGTGNYNPKTSRLYEDVGLLTASPDIGADLTDLFNSLTGYSRKVSYRNLLVAPYGVRRGIVERIEREIAAHRDGADARIRVKANALVDEQVIDALYRASQAGVPVEVVVRGICALRPGVQGFSENVTVRSILGRFLEHSRIIHFRAIDEFWIGSADMMHRNLDRRVEVMAQVKDPRLADQLNDVFESAMDPTTRCWELGADGHWTASPHEGETVRDHQVSLMERHRHP